MSDSINDHLSAHRGCNHDIRISSQHEAAQLDAGHAVDHARAERKMHGTCNDTFHSEAKVCRVLGSCLGVLSAHRVCELQARRVDEESAKH
jgi:hypothetical protein